jgi:hypothetical protein
MGIECFYNRAGVVAPSAAAPRLFSPPSTTQLKTPRSRCPKKRNKPNSALRCFGRQEAEITQGAARARPGTATFTKARIYVCFLCFNGMSNRGSATHDPAAG